MKPSQILKDLIFSRYGRPSINHVAIFGAGNNGLELKRFLEDCGVTLNFFIDSNPAKQGEIIESVPCISVNELARYKDDVLVFISPNQSEGIAEELARLGIQDVVPQQILKLIRFVPASRNLEAFTHLPPLGNFYSLYPDLNEILNKENVLFNEDQEILDLELNESQQLSILNQMTLLYSSIPQWEHISAAKENTPFRYRLGNPNLSAGDAVGLHCMLRILKPNKLIEVGSGYTSAVMLDTNEFYLNNDIELTFIEPYPELLRSLTKESDNIQLLEQKLQDTPLKLFEQLDSGDVLFIDSTHVSKIGSDVNYLFFEILPRLRQGVIIHFHDIFYPFEYPKHWIVKGQIWNELYVLRAFLQNNPNYSILFFQNMLEKRHRNIFEEKWPLNEPIHGGSIWIRKERRG